MSFLSPAFVALCAAALIPVVIHLTGKSRAQVKPFGAMLFLRAAHRKIAARTRLRQLLLMLLRAAVMAAVPLILAKPFTEALSDLPAQVGGAQSAVIVVDDSASMGVAIPGGTLLGRARARALRLAAALPRDAEVAVLTGAQGSQAPLPELTTDRGRVTRAIESVWQTQRGTDLAGAVKRAAQVMAGQGRSGGRRVYVLTDLTAHGLEGVAAPPEVELVLLDVTDGKALPNRAVTDLRVEPAPALGSGGVRVLAELANFSDAPLRDVTVTLWVDGKAVARGLLDLPARGRAVKRFYHVLGRGPLPESGLAPEDAVREDKPEKPEKADKKDPGKAKAPTEEGSHDVAVELPHDALQTDDRRVLRVDTRRNLRVLVVDGDPRNLRRDDEVFYLETALRPGDRDDSQLEVVTTLPGGVEELGRGGLRDFDAVFLCNVKAQELSRGRVLAILREYLDKGGGLFVALGDNVEPDAYNSTLGELLPQPLSVIKTTGPVGRERDALEREAAVLGPGERLGRIDRRHPILQPFGGPHGLEGLQEARFARYALLRPTPRGESGVTTVLALEGGAPLLVERPSGAGRVMLFASTMDRDWSDLPIQPSFLPLMQQAVRYLARAPQRDTGAAVLVGQRHEIRLSDLDARVEVTLPSGKKRLFEQERLKGRQVLGFVDTEEPGLYRVAAAGEGGVLRPRPAESFAVNLDPAESDLRRASAARLEALTRPQAGARDAGSAPKRRVELWHGLGALLLALLLGEALLLRGK